MIDIAMVDDDIQFLDYITDKILKLNKEIKVFSYNNPHDFMNDIDRYKYVLLDIEMPEINGINLSKQLRDNEISIFFITIHKEMMISAFGKNVEGFILKDNIEDGLFNLINFIDRQEEKKYLNLVIDHNEIKIDFCNILSINYSLRDIEYCLLNNKRIIQKNKNLKDAQQFLNKDFIQINRTCIININHVDCMKNGYLYIKNFKYKISRRRIKDVKIKFIERELNY